MAAVLAFGGLALLAPGAGAASTPSPKFCAAANKIGSNKGNSSDLQKFSKLASTFKAAGKYAPAKVKSAANNIASVLTKAKALVKNPTDLAKIYTSSDFKNYGNSISTFFVYAAQCAS
jgi:hypothetical protein